MSPFLTMPELRKITGTDNPAEQIAVLQSYGLHPVAPKGRPVIYREVVMDIMRGGANDDINIDWSFLRAKAANKG